MVQLFFTTYISVDLAHHEIFRAKFGKGRINTVSRFFKTLPLLIITNYCQLYHLLDHLEHCCSKQCGPRSKCFFTLSV